MKTATNKPSYYSPTNGRKLLEELIEGVVWCVREIFGSTNDIRFIDFIKVDERDHGAPYNKSTFSVLCTDKRIIHILRFNLNCKCCNTLKYLLAIVASFLLLFPGRTNAHQFLSVYLQTILWIGANRCSIGIDASTDYTAWTTSSTLWENLVGRSTTQFIQVKYLFCLTLHFKY